MDTSSVHIFVKAFAETSNLNPIIKMVNPGDPMHIPCSVMHPGGSVQWIRNGKPILLDFSPTQRRHWNISNEGQAALTINRVSKQDEGLWECWELDSDGNVKQKAHVMKLIVTNVPEEPYLKIDGKRTQANAKITVRENNAVSLECVVRGASPAVRVVNWFIAGENITQSSQLLMEYSPEEDNYETRSLLVVNATKQEHTKGVTCQAEHISWQHPAAVSASFDVLYEPSFTISREPGFGYPIIEGMSVYLKCEIDANPASDPYWIRDVEKNNSNHYPSLSSSQSFTGAVLNLSSIKVSDSGWFRCVTDHAFGHFESFGYYLNSHIFLYRRFSASFFVRIYFHRKPISVTIIAQLPKLQHVLKLPLSPPSSSNSRSNVDNKIFAHEVDSSRDDSEERHPQSLHSPSVSNTMDIMVNSGMYSNHHQMNAFHGNSDGKQRNCLDARGRPSIVSWNRTVMAIEGRSIALYVSFCCEQRVKKVYWIHRHLAIPPGRSIGPYITKELLLTNTDPPCFTSQFNIDKVKPEDKGDIMFIVSSSRGLEDAVIQLNVTTAGFSISQGSINDLCSVVNCVL
ncbi:Immunoglobulin I-set domain containing protein 7-like protein [Leptotrombidium deliense]|uniref:Immunoglobulin I-set domain containing protein 7-like protein n=1 Tax=Leptotrombidium deliense TaxID=299467 RepID=A0A443SIK9_9ACAR|nr:Immunoglobulin I-set domain containing protein 7-like protein [Leptotrombidium deliense]